MTQELKWDFVSTGGGDTDGLNNSMIEHFTGNYNYFLAREIIQNSLDAKDKQNSSPVKVIFKLEMFSENDFPGFTELKQIIEAAKKFWQHNKETISFLDKALKCLQKKEIPFLRISDYNTIGLSGNDDDMSGGWFNLVRSTGASSKSSGEGGSFGIGKGAPFAASDLRTVFYSTKNQNSVSVFQGKAELVSFKDEESEVRRGVGSYGIGQKAVRKVENIPTRFWRKIQGTDIIIAGYKFTTDWVEDLLKSILRNFWYAIHSNDLEVIVQDININKENLAEQLADYFAKEPFKDYVEPTGNPLQYYLAIVQGEELSKGKALKHLGNAQFYFKLIESHMNYVAMLRKSHMVIYSRRFNFPGSFAGVFICNNEQGNIELRKMEPPAHDKWDPKRNKESGDEIMNEITTFIRDCLESVKQKQSFGILEIPDLQKYLPYDEGDENGNGNGEMTYSGKESDNETSKTIQKKDVLESKVVINPFRVAIINERDNQSGNENGQGGNKNNGTGGDKGTGGGKGDGKSKKIKDIHFRSYIINQDNDSATYKLIIRSLKDVRCNLKISAVGEEGSENLKILKVFDTANSKYFFSGNKIQQLSLSSGSNKTFNIQISTLIKMSLKIEANDLQQ